MSKKHWVWILVLVASVMSGLPSASAQNRMLQDIGADNRLADPSFNRCTRQESWIAPEKCAEYQNRAWSNGNGCLTAEEHEWARVNGVAPMCDYIDPRLYIGWCRCGCFDISTEISAFDRVSGAPSKVRVSDITVAQHDVFALSEEARLEDLYFEPRKLLATTAGGEEQPLVWLKLANGVALGLTTEHAVLLSSGEMVAARELEAGRHRLVLETGESVAIDSIERRPTTENVFNVLTDAGLDHKGHLIIANGVIVGDVMWQNTLASDLHAIVIRS